MAEAMDDAPGKLVRQCLRISKIRYDQEELHISLYSPEPAGLRADDLIPEENDTVQLALKRLPPKEAYDRVFRLRRAFQVRREDEFAGSREGVLTMYKGLASTSIATGSRTNQTRRGQTILEPNHRGDRSGDEGACGLGGNDCAKEVVGRKSRLRNG